MAPENTLTAFRAAVDLWRTDMLELDVHLSRDGVAWVSHDPTVDRCTDGSGEISQLSSDELEQLDAGHRFSLNGQDFPFRGQGVGLARFSEVLGLFPNMLFNVELKTDAAGAAETFAEVVQRSGASDRVCCGAERDGLAGELVQLLPGVCLFYPGAALADFIMKVGSGATPEPDERFHVLDMPAEHQGIDLVTSALLEAARHNGKWVNVWTINDEPAMRRLVQQGVGGVMTDRPDLLRRILGS